MATSAGIHPKLARQLAGRCCYGACPDPALDGSDYCAPHDAHEKGRAKRKQQRRRQRRADRGLCSAGCGRKVGKRIKNGRAAQRRCAICSKTHKAAERDRRGVPGEVRGVPGAEHASPPVKLEVGRDGATRTRYVPRPGQGGPSRDEIDRGLLRDLRESLGHLQRLVSRWPPPRDAIAALPRIQRGEAWDLVADPAVQAIRMAYGVIAALPTSWGATCPCCGHEQSGPDVD